MFWEYGLISSANPTNVLESFWNESEECQPKWEVNGEKVNFEHNCWAFFPGVGLTGLRWSEKAKKVVFGNSNRKKMPLVDAKFKVVLGAKICKLNPSLAFFQMNKNQRVPLWFLTNMMVFGEFFPKTGI